MADHLRELINQWNADAANLDRAGVNAPYYDKGAASAFRQCADNLASAIVAAPQPEDQACAKCGATNADEAGLMCKPSGDDCPGVGMWDEAQEGADDEQRARNLLAAEWRASGHDDIAMRIAQPRLLTTDNPAIRAIMKALAIPKPAESGAVKARIDEIEYAIACNRITAPQVFTQMRQLITTGGSREA